MVSNRTSSAPVLDIEPDLTERLEQQYKATPTRRRRDRSPHLEQDQDAP